MTKRRIDDSSFANVLRQKVKEDPIIKQQVAQNTFALLMKAQQHQQQNTPRAVAEPSYKYFNATQAGTPVHVEPKCQKCNHGTIYDKCTFCEKTCCIHCLQQCNGCQYLFCSACSIIDYSMSLDQVFCISCKQD